MVTQFYKCTERVKNTLSVSFSKNENVMYVALITLTCATISNKHSCHLPRKYKLSCVTLL